MHGVKSVTIFHLTFIIVSIPVASSSVGGNHFPFPTNAGALLFVRFLLCVPFAAEACRLCLDAWWWMVLPLNKVKLMKNDCVRMVNRIHGY